MMDSVRCLLLDLGKVVVSLDYDHFANGMKRLTGLGPVQLQELFASDELANRFECGAITQTQFFEEVCGRTRSRISWSAFLEAWNSIIGPALIPEETIAALARNLRLWAISNTNCLHYEFLERRYPFWRLFEGFVLSHQVGALKPDPRIFRHALDQIRECPSAILFVDDQEINVAAARELGIEGFQFQNPGQFADELKSRGLL